MNIFIRPCDTDDDLAKASLFFLKHRFDLHPSISTVFMLELLHSYMTKGSLHVGIQADDQVVLAGAYYHGTPDNDFKDQEVVLIDVVIIDPHYRGTRAFLQCLKYVVSLVLEKHPEVSEIRLAALSDNAYLCKLYSKFTSFTYKRDGVTGEETIFCENINKIAGMLKRFDRV